MTSSKHSATDTGATNIEMPKKRPATLQSNHQIRHKKSQRLLPDPIQIIDSNTQKESKKRAKFNQPKPSDSARPRAWAPGSARRESSGGPARGRGREERRKEAAVQGRRGRRRSGGGRRRWRHRPYEASDGRSGGGWPVSVAREAGEPGDE